MNDQTAISGMLSDRERIAQLERAVFNLSEHAALHEGTAKVLEYLLTGHVLRRAAEDVAPYEWLQNYVSTAAAGCRQIPPNVADPTTRAYIAAGINLAADGFFRRLLERSGDLDGAPKGPRANI